MNKENFNTKVTIILLWITMLLNMIFADIFSIIVEIVNGGVLDIPLDVLKMMAIAAVITNIPILMIVLTWVLPFKINKWLNIIAAILTVVYIIGGAAFLPHYYIIASIEIVLLITIITIAIKWKSSTLKIMI